MKDLVRSMGISTRKEFQIFASSDDFPFGQKKTPNFVYKNKGWKGWKDFLGNG